MDNGCLYLKLMFSFMMCNKIGSVCGFFTTSFLQLISLATAVIKFNLSFGLIYFLIFNFFGTNEGKTSLQGTQDHASRRSSEAMVCCM